MTVLGLLALLSLPATSRAQEGTSPIEGRWSLSFRGGLDLPLGGDVHAGGVGTVLGLPTTVDAKNYGDVYGTTFRGEAQINLPTLAGTGLESINDTGERWSMPVLFTATLRF
jgi:hypothetical protein